MTRSGRFSLYVLMALVAAPAALLLVRAFDLFRPSVPYELDLSDGRRVLSIRLPMDAGDAASRHRRYLVSNGDIESIPEATILGRRRADQAWMFQSEDAPVELGYLYGLATPEGDTLRGDRLEHRIGTIRAELRQDRRTLLRALREARDPVSVRLAQARWHVFTRSEARTGVLVRNATGHIAFLRMSSIRDMTRLSGTGIHAVRIWIERVVSALTDSSDRWGIGGLRDVVISTLLLIVLSGAIGGTLAILAALLLSERLRPGGWAMVVKRSSSWLAAVPGVVWGAVGFGLLVKVLGSQLDSLTGVPDKWSNGGLLWAALTLGILAAPISLKRALDALDRVPRQWRLVARSCGATRWQVLRLVVLPAVWPGLAGAWFSAFARAAGETAPLFLVGAIHSANGVLVGSGNGAFSLSGEFLHLGVLACDPAWPRLESEMGHPVAYLSLLVLTLFCIGFELLAAGFLGQPIATIPDEART